MADPFVGEIRVFGFNFAPRGWALCNGQLLPLSQNTALFSLLGTQYGGDGRSTFGLPNYQGSVAVSQGQGSGLSVWDVGQSQGETSTTLLLSEIPVHNHVLNVTSANGTQVTSTNAQLARGFKGTLASSTTARMYSAAAPDQPMSPQALNIAGSGLPHNNMMPYLTFNFCIALQGVFPPRG